MKQKLESIVRKGRMIVLSSLLLFMMGCASSRFYVKPKVGMITPISAKEQKYNSSTTIGGALGLSGKVLGLEASLDSFNSSAECIKTKSTLSRVNLNFNLSTAKVKPYLITGINSLNESSIIDIPQYGVHEKVKNNTTGLEFGMGIIILNRIDGRATYTIMLGSENAKGTIAWTLGYRFSFGSKK